MHKNLDSIVSKAERMGKSRQVSHFASIRMIKRRISLQFLVVVVKSKLLYDIIDSLLQRNVIKATALNQGLAVVDPGSYPVTQPIADVVSVDLRAEHLLSDGIVHLDGVLGCHAKSEEHDADDAASAGSSGELKVISWTARLIQILPLLDPLHDLIQDDQSSDSSDATSIKGKKANAIGVFGSRDVGHCVLASEVNGGGRGESRAELHERSRTHAVKYVLEGYAPVGSSETGEDRT